MGRAHCGAIQKAVRTRKYADQKAITEKNRIVKRKKHLKRHPNDLQTAALV